MMTQRYQPQRSQHLPDHWTADSQQDGGRLSRNGSRVQNDVDRRYIVRTMHSTTGEDRLINGSGGGRTQDGRRAIEMKLPHETHSPIYESYGTIQKRPENITTIRARDQHAALNSPPMSVPRYGGSTGGRSAVNIVSTRATTGSSTLPRTTKHTAKATEYINFGQLASPARLLSRYSSDTDGGTSSDSSYSPKILLHTGPTSSTATYRQTPLPPRSINNTVLQGHGVEYHPKIRVTEKISRNGHHDSNPITHRNNQTGNDTSTSGVYVNGNDSVLSDSYSNGSGNSAMYTGYSQRGNAESLDGRRLNGWTPLNGLHRLGSADDLSDNSSSSRTLVPRGWTGSADDLLDTGRNVTIQQPSIVISSPKSGNDTWSDESGDLSLSSASSLRNNNHLSHYRSLPDCRVPTSGSILKKPKHHVTRLNSRGHISYGANHQTDGHGLVVNGRASTRNQSSNKLRPSRRVDFQNNVSVYRFDSDGNDSSACSSSECEKLNEEPTRDHKRLHNRLSNRAGTPLPRHQPLLIPNVTRSHSCNDLTLDSGSSQHRGGTLNRGGNSSKGVGNSKSSPLMMNVSNSIKFFPHVKSNTLERKSSQHNGKTQTEKFIPDRIVFGNGTEPSAVLSPSPLVRYATTKDERLLPDITANNGLQSPLPPGQLTRAMPNANGDVRIKYKLVNDPTTSSKILVATVQLESVDHNGLNPQNLVVQSSKNGRKIHVTTRCVSSSSSRLNIDLSLPCRVDPYDITAGLDSFKNLVIEATVVE